jgi:transcriptional regulator with XRE-family HTH domain
MIGVRKILITQKGAKAMENYAAWFARRLRDTLGERTQSELILTMKDNGFEILGGRLSHYMQGRNYPDPDVLAELAKALGVSADYLLGLTEDKTPAGELSESLATTKGEGKIDRLIRHLSPEERRQVIDYAEYLVARHVDAGKNLTQRERDSLRAERAIGSVEKEFGEIVRIELEKIIRAKGMLLDRGSK